MVKTGEKYRHYKGNEYVVLALARHSETLEEMVVYQDLSDISKIWTRPLEMFEQTLPDSQKRFEKINM